ncbi:hypothetical protein EC973_005709 [Apophysomyces ossiformis]|uniref:Uncharacterized protein n=1 Tax=Apophysomyces ossiformis TaxID=679940 RepID=A0A8H7BU65_9FUNG|nr:hypothetical protein EC973_005709 [Apophysomyces ossiformis]
MPKETISAFERHDSIVSFHMLFKEEETLATENEAKEKKKTLPKHNYILTRRQRRWFVVRRVIYIVVMNAAIPIALYNVLKSHIRPVWALVLSTTPTIISVIGQAIFLRHIDTMGVAVVSGFILSVILAVINGDPKLLMMRESFVTSGVGLMCAITLIPVRIRTFQLKPILYYLACDLIPLQPVCFHDQSQPQKRMAFYWDQSSFFRLHLRLLTAINLIILELEFGLKLYYILTFDLDTIVILSSSTLTVVGILVTMFVFWYIVIIHRRIKADEPSMLHRAGAVE